MVTGLFLSVVDLLKPLFALGNGTNRHPLGFNITARQLDAADQSRMCGIELCIAVDQIRAAAETAMIDISLDG